MSISLLKTSDDYVSSRLEFTSEFTVEQIAPSSDFTLKFHQPVAKIAWLDPFAEQITPRNRAELVLTKIDRWREGNPR